MRKFLVRAIPVIAVIAFVCIMLSGEYMKKPRNEQEDVNKYISVTMAYAEAEDWDKAQEEIEKLDNACRKVLKRVQFGSELDEINDITNNIARIKGAIKAKDLGITLSGLTEFYDQWENIAK
ncbi:DUF4363 family protein [Clostridium niameyense]|uniref:DUF4363 family protein n=1 Tax=Clostridium niameyense TaxID=1622073 RepID=UPI00067EF2EC|nr:DUF4363 family protein [Clostridium niameyense]